MKEPKGIYCVYQCFSDARSVKAVGVFSCRATADQFILRRAGANTGIIMYVKKWRLQ